MEEQGQKKHLRRGIKMVPDIQRQADDNLGWLWNPEWGQGQTRRLERLARAPPKDLECQTKHGP